MGNSKDVPAAKCSRRYHPIAPSTKPLDNDNNTNTLRHATGHQQANKKQRQANALASTKHC
jgi:hypothetical protein